MFQQKNNEMFDDIADAHFMLDIMIIAFSMWEDHDILKVVMERTQ